MKQLPILLIFFLITSCIPIRIAPKIKDYKVKVAKKFKRNLPRDHAFIFKDPKEADEFYNYLNIRYQLNHQNVDENILFTIDDNKFFLSFYETEIPTKTINLLPMLIDAALDSKEMGTYFEDIYMSRKGNWYLVLTVFDVNMKDCLKPNHKYQKEVIIYLKNLKREYLSTNNYFDPLFRN